jgi:hypothetical protein
VPLPPGVRPPFDVFVNGVPQQLGADYEVEANTLVFRRELAREGKLGFKGWFLGFWGIGTYRSNDTVDIRYEQGGRPMVAHSVKPEA